MYVKLASALDSFSLLRPQEKTYMQTDRNIYRAGEVIYFKTYAVLYEKPTVLSKVIYAELLNIKGEILEKKMLKITNGGAAGSFDLKKTMSGGDHIVRCYTLWMLNFPDYIFEKKIKIFGDESNPENKLFIPKKINCSFFPEGGDLINGIKSKVAFKIISNTDDGNFSGILTDDRDNNIANFTSLHNGMGVFEFTPQANRSYKVKFKNTSLNGKSFIIPLARNEGLTLSVDNNNSTKVFAKVETNEINKAAYNKLLVIAQMNNNIVYTGTLNIEEGLDAFAINKKTLPAGIMQITIFSESGKPLAERLVFIANHTIKKEIIVPILIDTNKRRQNTLSLNFENYKNMDASISVVNGDIEMANNGTNILSALLLTNDIKGEVYNPAYYFKDKEPLTLQYLDLVMMTNGWRRFKWEEILENKFSPIKFSFERGLSISGKVLQSNDKPILKGAKINLIINGEDSTKILSEAITNETSSFIIDNLDFKKQATIYYQGTNTDNTGAIVKIIFNNNYFDSLQKLELKDEQRALVFPNEDSSYINKFLSDKMKQENKVRLLESVVVNTKKISTLDSLNSKYATNYFYDSDQTLSLDSKQSFIDMFQFFRMYVPGILIDKSSGESVVVSFQRLQNLDIFSQNAGNVGIQFFLNEIPVSTDVVESLSPSDIGLVKVYKGTTAIALGATNGAIALYTLKDKSIKDWRTKGFNFIKRSGYSVTREFYQMNYSNSKNDSEFEDIRPTLYWNPSIKIINGNATIHFHNDDNCKSYKILVEGIDENGKIVHAEKVYN